jgi:outer membrane receptor protein involved in Fe transport
LSPRLSFTYKPFEHTTLHAGYARYFTPPILVEAAPSNIALFNGTTGAPPGTGTSPVLPERSHYFDAGINQVIPLGCYSALKRDCASAEFGVDAYYKIAKDLLDDGNFGQALVLNAFNYEKGINEGVEFSAKFHSSYLEAYFNYAYARQKATHIVSNQFLFDNMTPNPALGGQTEFDYIATHWIFTDHAQIQTASAGAGFRFCGHQAEVYEVWSSWCGTRLSADMIYGSGLRQGDANIDHLPPYVQFNAGISRQFSMPDGLPVTLRFDVVNVLDTIYQIRSGSGIGVFAPQFGPRRGFFFGVSKKI